MYTINEGRHDLVSRQHNCNTSLSLSLLRNKVYIYKSCHCKNCILTTAAFMAYEEEEWQKLISIHFSEPKGAVGGLNCPTQQLDCQTRPQIFKQKS